MAKSSYRKKKSAKEQAQAVQGAMNLYNHRSVLSYEEIVDSGNMVNVGISPEDKFLYNAF